MYQRLGMVFGFDRHPASLIFFGMSLRVLDHLLDVGLGQTARCLDADLLFLARRFVLGGHDEDAVGVDVEGDLDLWHAA